MSSIGQRLRQLRETEAIRRAEAAKLAAEIKLNQERNSVDAFFKVFADYIQFKIENGKLLDTPIKLDSLLAQLNAESYNGNKHLIRNAIYIGSTSKNINQPDSEFYPCWESFTRWAAANELSIELEVKAAFGYDPHVSLLFHVNPI